jgi:hypothetical protein
MKGNVVGKVVGRQVKVKSVGDELHLVDMTNGQSLFVLSEVEARVVFPPDGLAVVTVDFTASRQE